MGFNFYLDRYLRALSREVHGRFLLEDIETKGQDQNEEIMTTSLGRIKEYQKLERRRKEERRQLVLI